MKSPIYIIVAFVVTLVGCSFIDFKQQKSIKQSDAFATHLIAKNDSLMHRISALEHSITKITYSHQYTEDSLRLEILILCDSISRLTALRSRSPTIRWQEQQARFRLEKVKRYVRIVEHNPTQKKFFFGWIRRAIN